MLRKLLHNEKETLIFAKELAAVCDGPCVIFLCGPLGAGKTALARGFVQAKGYQGTVPSPTYSLVQQYDVGKWPIVHMDLYRLDSPEDFQDLGMLDYVGKAIWLIEWPEKGADTWLLPDFTCRLSLEDAHRELVLEALSPEAEKTLARLQGM